MMCVREKQWTQSSIVCVTNTVDLLEVDEWHEVESIASDDAEDEREVRLFGHEIITTAWEVYRCRVENVTEQGC